MSGLPETNIAWPPAGHARRYDRMRECAAWYEGDVSKLSGVYAGTPGAAVVTANGFRGITQRLGAGFWHEPSPQGARHHLPIANDIATRSADLLFADPPTFTIDAPEPEAGPNGEPAEVPADVQAAQARLDAILDASNAEALFLQAAEVAAALGSVVLRIAYDESGPSGKKPILTVVHADAAVPVYRWGQLVATTIWRTLPGTSDQDVYRHLEHHERGYVEHALYRGSPDRIGRRIPLADHPDTRELAEQVDAESRILLDPAGGLTAVSIPNMLPDPADRNAQAGRSDYTAPVIDLMDAADGIYTRMLEHIDDARSRIIIAEALLTRRGAGRGVEFDMGQRVFTKVKYPAAENPTGGLPIEKVQFDMHVAEHLQALDALQQRAIQAAGYSTRTDQGSDGDAMTATEVGATERKSLATRDRKVRYWRAALARLATTLLSVDRFLFPAEAAPVAFPVRVAFPEAVQPSPLDLANLATALRASGGASTTTIVEALHPDWSQGEIDDEVGRIENVAAVMDPATFRDPSPGLGI